MWKKRSLKPRRRRATRRGRAVRRRRALNNNTRKAVNRIQLKTNTQLLTSNGIPGGGAGVYTWYAYSLANPNYSPVQQHPEFKLHKNMYDEYCVHSCTVKYIPRVVDVGLSQSTNTVTLYSFVDRDGKAPVSSSLDVPAKLQAYESCWRTSLYRSFKRTLYARPYWLDSNIDYSEGNEVLRGRGLEQIVGIYGQNLPVAASTSLGDLEVTWTVSFRGKKPSSFSMDSEGRFVLDDTEIEGMPPFNVEFPSDD